MAFRVVMVNRLEDGSFYFRARHWADETSMRKDATPEWENDFITDLHLLAGQAVNRLKVRHNPQSQESLMQRADNEEWRPVSEWHEEGGLLAQGVEPVREDVVIGQAEIETMVRETVQRYIGRRSTRTAATAQSGRDAGLARDAVTGGLAGEATRADGLFEDFTDSALRSLPSRKAELHPYLQAMDGFEEASL